MVKINEQCQQEIYGGREPSWLCQKKAVVERDGKFYCKIHDPEYIEEKHRKWREKFDKEFAENTIRDHRKSVIRKVCEPFSTEWLEANMTMLKASKDMYEACGLAVEWFNQRILDRYNIDKSILNFDPQLSALVMARTKAEGK